VCNKRQWPLITAACRTQAKWTLPSPHRLSWLIDCCKFCTLVDLAGSPKAGRVTQNGVYYTLFIQGNSPSVIV